jgi:hypothetical protein
LHQGIGFFVSFFVLFFSFSSLSRSGMSQFEAEIEQLKDAIVSLSWEDMFAIINLWFVVSTLGNIFALVYSIR